MHKRERLTLDIRIEELGYGFYHIAGRVDELGQTEAKMKLSPDDSQLLSLLESIYAYPAGEQDVRQIGWELAKSLLGPLGGFWGDFRDLVGPPGKAPLAPIIRLDILPPALQAFPWEMMLDEDRQPIANFASIVRYRQPPVVRPVSVRGPLRLLLATAAPDNYPPADIPGNLDLVRDSLRPLEIEGVLETQVIEGATLDRLQAALADGRHHLFHYLGHMTNGRMGQVEEQDVGLLLEGGKGGSELLSTSQFLRLCGRNPDLQVVILTTTSTPPVAFPPSLVRKQTVQAVMSSRLTERRGYRDLGQFWRVFYRQLTTGAAVDMALFEARQELLLRPGPYTADWGIPFLTMTGSGYPFSLIEPAYRPDEDPVIPGNQVPPMTPPADTGDLENDLKALLSRRDKLERLRHQKFAPRNLEQMIQDVDQRIDATRRRLSRWQ